MSSTTFYVNIIEECGNSSWYKIINELNHNDQSIKEIIGDLIKDLDGMNTLLRDNPPTEEELFGAPLQNYTDLKLFLAMHMLGLN